jgi:hypothetical protein
MTAEIKAAAESAGIRTGNLNEGIVYAIAPGLTDNPAGVDSLAEQVARFLQRGTRASENYAESYMMATVIRPDTPCVNRRWRDVFGIPAQGCGEVAQLHAALRHQCGCNPLKYAQRDCISHRGIATLSSDIGNYPVEVNGPTVEIRREIQRLAEGDPADGIHRVESDPFPIHEYGSASGRRRAQRVNWRGERRRPIGPTARACSAPLRWRCRSCANFSFAFVDAMVLALLTFWFCRRRGQTAGQYAKLLAACILPGLALTLFLAGSILANRRQITLVWGAKSLTETALDVIRASLYWRILNSSAVRN